MEILTRENRQEIIENGIMVVSTHVNHTDTVWDAHLYDGVVYLHHISEDWDWCRGMAFDAIYDFQALRAVEVEEKARLKACRKGLAVAAQVSKPEPLNFGRVVRYKIKD